MEPEKLRGTSGLGAPHDRSGDAAVLYCIAANYRQEPLEALIQSTGQDRHAVVNQTVAQTGGTVLAMRATLSGESGPGTMTIIDIEPVAAAAIAQLMIASGNQHNVRVTQLLICDEVRASRVLAKELWGNYRLPTPE
jgi:hypothetical protein